jgi:hypothetical protein
VIVSHDKVHADDCADCETAEGKIEQNIARRSQDPHDAGRPCLVPPNTLPPVLLFRLPLEDWVRQGGFVDFDLGFFRSRNLETRAHRQPVRAGQSVNYVSGIRCKPCDRNTP